MGERGGVEREGVVWILCRDKGARLSPEVRFIIIVEAVSVFLGTRRIKAPIFFQMFFTIIAFNLE